MEPGKKPQGREKQVASGTAHVAKGEKVSTGGKTVGSGSRPSSSQANRPQGGYRPSQSGGQRGQDDRSVGGVATAVGLLALFAKLPKKTRRLALIVIVAILLFSVVKGGSGNVGIADYGTSSSYSSTYQEPAQSQSVQTVPATAVPVTPAPTPVPTPAPTPMVASLASGRDYRVTPMGSGKDTVTIMIYMCGTDLESSYGMGTADLGEMIKAQIDSSKVNVLVMTGGCKKWKNNIVSSSVNQIYKVETGGLKRLVADAGNSAMTNPDNLTSFIQYCSKNYPASRNILIFWDHGGGSLTGYGYDEKNPASSSMTLDKINSALGKAGVTFDWIGFDACLMATLETALVCEKYADYMIASEESEPGTGWYYTDWLTKLSSNTSTPTVDIAKIIIDTFVSTSTASSKNAQVTLSVMDLAELSGSGVSAFKNFSTATSAALSGSNYNAIASARSGTRQFASSSKLNQIDLIDFCNRLGSAESAQLASALSSCVKYNKSTISRAYGVSIYFPYESSKNVNSAISTYNSIGLDDSYSSFIKDFASMQQGGQFASAGSNAYGSGSFTSGDMSDLLGTLLGSYGSSGYSSSSSYSANATSSLLGSLMGGYSSPYGGSSSSAGYGMDASSLLGLMSAFGGRSMPGELSWVNTDLIAAQAEDLASNYLDPSRLFVTMDGSGRRMLELTDEDWALVNDIELNVFVEDEDGFIDLGRDTSSYNDWDGNALLLDWDGTWLTVNGQPAAFYLESEFDDDGDYTIVGSIPARITTAKAGLDETLVLAEGDYAANDNATETVTILVNLQVVFNDAAPDGEITGFYPLYADETETESKGMMPVRQGDEITLLCDHYTLDGDFDSAYTLGESFTVGADGLNVVYKALDNENFSVTYRISDYFGNFYWLPAWNA